jgi:ABC-type xylose transport system permease subunit
VSVDPILVQRERVRRIANAAKRTGYVLFLLSMVLFFVALATDLSSGPVAAATGALIAGCVVLAPAILLGYAVKGAERDDAERHGL